VLYVNPNGARCRIPGGIAQSAHDYRHRPHDRVPNLSFAISRSQGRSDLSSRLHVIIAFGVFTGIPRSGELHPNLADTFVLYSSALLACVIWNAD
jgi:hypothetical protein